LYVHKYYKENKRDIFLFKKDGLRQGQVRKRLLGQNGEHTISKEAEEVC